MKTTAKKFAIAKLLHFFEDYSIKSTPPSKSRNTLIVINSRTIQGIVFEFTFEYSVAIAT